MRLFKTSLKTMTSSDPYYHRAFFQKVANDADQAELVALRSGRARTSSGIHDDQIAETVVDFYGSQNGFDEADWQLLETSLDGASSQINAELERRSKALRGLYPFTLNGDILTYEQLESQLYEFLLCASLTSNLTKGPNCNFPRIFERIAAELSANFMGSNARYCHIGWPNCRKRFKAAVMTAIEASGELKWQPDDGLPNSGPISGDEGVDYIIWKEFGCGRPIGQPFYFGQCACGNDWDTKLKDVSERFFKWFARLKVKPGKFLAVPYVVPDIKLKEASRDAGIVMDRLRLVMSMEEGPHFDKEKWTDKMFETLCLVAAA